MRIFSLIKSAIRMSNFKEVRLCFSLCPICLAKRPIIKLSNNEIAIRCTFCRSSVVTMSIASIINEHVSDISNIEIYELSSRGPLFKFLNTHCEKLKYSEYFKDVRIGEYKKGIQCQDVQNLTYQDNSFDLCTSTDVFEHVPNDTQGFENIYRVLKPKGLFIFTVPLLNEAVTIERATVSEEGIIEHHLPPEFHGDPMAESDSILAFRNYGKDIKDKLKSVGFQRTLIIKPESINLWGFNRNVITAYK